MVRCILQVYLAQYVGLLCKGSKTFPIDWRFGCESENVLKNDSQTIAWPANDR